MMGLFPTPRSPTKYPNDSLFQKLILHRYKPKSLIFDRWKRRRIVIHSCINKSEHVSEESQSL